MNNNFKIRNKENPFTELFSLLKHYQISSNEMPLLAYKSADLKIIHQHADNAIDTLLQGMQEIGQLLGVYLADKNLTIELNQLGFFISVVNNLILALNDLRTDSDYVLKERGITNF